MVEFSGDTLTRSELTEDPRQENDPGQDQAAEPRLGADSGPAEQVQEPQPAVEVPMQTPSLVEVLPSQASSDVSSGPSLPSAPRARARESPSTDSGALSRGKRSCGPPVRLGDYVAK